METTMSVDGTEIVFERSGNGPILMLVYGNGDVYKFWELAGVRSSFANHCTVCVIERRGRGESGENDAYELEREAEDVAAVVEAIDEPVTLLGHSGGALYSLEAALRTANIHKLILFEPVFASSDNELPPEETFTGMEPLLDDGKNEQVLVSFLSDIATLSPEELDELRSAHFWKEMVNAATVLPRELRAITNYEFDASRFSAMTTPTLFLTGSESLPLFRDATKVVNDALPDSRITSFDGQEHAAMLTATDRFINEVLAFINESN